ncbi:MAG: asparagine synthetase B, partial [Ruminococcus sp.]|nr:asparagine synthetase B [Ruminococcus sp.]
MAEIREYRGHIRNWKELCAELGIDSSLSRQERETEIITKAYEKWGRTMADHIYGMFAFYLYDEKEDKIFALRDQFGTKPFYYYVTADNKLLCSTMIRTIMEQDGFVKELNADMLQIYMSLTYVAGEDTFFKGVKKLMPGHWLEFKNGKLEIGRYWTPTFKPDDSKTVEQWADEIHSTLTNIYTQVKEP